MLFSNGNIRLQARRDNAVTTDIFHIQNIIMLLLGRRGWDPIFSKERFRWLPIYMSGRSGNQLSLWRAQRSELTAKDTARINIYRVIQPFVLVNRCMTID